MKLQRQVFVGKQKMQFGMNFVPYFVDFPDSSVQKPDMPSLVELQGKNWDLKPTFGSVNLNHLVSGHLFLVMDQTCLLCFKESTEIFQYEETTEQKGIYRSFFHQSLTNI